MAGAGARARAGAMAGVGDDEPRMPASGPNRFELLEESFLYFGKASSLQVLVRLGFLTTSVFSRQHHVAHAPFSHGRPPHAVSVSPSRNFLFLCNLL